MKSYNVTVKVFAKDEGQARKIKDIISEITQHVKPELLDYIEPKKVGNMVAKAMNNPGALKTVLKFLK